MTYLVNGQRLQSVIPPSLPPGNITWEKVNTAEVGLDVSFLKNSLTTHFDYYQRQTNGMLTKSEVLPAVLGTIPPTTNAADMRTRGFEFKISYNKTFQVAGKSFHLGFTGTVSNDKSKITKYKNPNKSLDDYYVGQTIGEIWGYHSNGLFQSDKQAANHANQDFVNSRRIGAPGDHSKLHAGDVSFVDLNGDGKIDNGSNTVEDRVIVP
jgi:outer membrane receptor protein involved in Fe transport